MQDESRTNGQTKSLVEQLLEAQQEIERLTKLAYIGEHFYPALTYKARLEEVQGDLEVSERVSLSLREENERYKARIGRMQVRCPWCLERENSPCPLHEGAEAGAIDKDAAGRFFWYCPNCTQRTGDNTGPRWLSEVRAEKSEQEIRALRERVKALEAAMRDLRIDANRLCDRNQGGTYEDDCLRSIAKVDALLAPPSQPTPEAK